MNNLYSELEYRLSILESLMLIEDDSGVIRKVSNKWKILKKDRKHYWDAEYDTKKDAEDALKAYWANKHESRNLTIEQRIKRLESIVSKSLVERYKDK